MATTWEKTETGYVWTAAGATLTKNGKSWTLTYRGQTVDLGRRASFDHAEAAMAKIDRS